MTNTNTTTETMPTRQFRDTMRTTIDRITATNQPLLLTNHHARTPHAYVLPVDLAERALAALDAQTAT